MVEVVLFTNDGREVVRIQLPPFVSWPEGVQWGQRTFFRKTPRESFPPVYEEGLLWVQPPERVLKEMGLVPSPPSAEVLQRRGDAAARFHERLQRDLQQEESR